ncbi:hypothetical protein SHAb15599_00110 [Acinetobacter phage SH-Ab 15599]|nr:hypothetical protein SHAb15599_00110 [Acinetobacter phage SH-Ab 15599]
MKIAIKESTLNEIRQQHVKHINHVFKTSKYTLVCAERFSNKEVVEKLSEAGYALDDSRAIHVSSTTVTNIPEQGQYALLRLFGNPFKLGKETLGNSLHIIENKDCLSVNTETSTYYVLYPIKNI